MKTSETWLPYLVRWTNMGAISLAWFDCRSMKQIFASKCVGKQDQGESITIHLIDRSNGKHSGRTHASK